MTSEARLCDTVRRLKGNHDGIGNEPNTSIKSWGCKPIKDLARKQSSGGQSAVKRRRFRMMTLSTPFENASFQLELPQLYIYTHLSSGTER
jgi:hypothetical protein